MDPYDFGLMLISTRDAGTRVLCVTESIIDLCDERYIDGDDDANGRFDYGFHFVSFAPARFAHIRMTILFLFCVA